MASTTIISPLEAVGLLVLMGVAMYLLCKETRPMERHADAGPKQCMASDRSF